MLNTNVHWENVVPTVCFLINKTSSSSIENKVPLIFFQMTLHIISLHMQLGVLVLFTMSLQVFTNILQRLLNVPFQDIPTFTMSINVSLNQKLLYILEDTKFFLSSTEHSSFVQQVLLTLQHWAQINLSSLAKDPHDSYPSLPDSNTMDLASSLPSPNSNHALPIALRKRI